MAEFSKLIITNKGQALIAKMIAGTGNIEFTKISASSTTYTEEQLQDLTSLSNVKQTSLISKITRTNHIAVKVETAFTNAELTVGYYMKALGLYAKDPDDGEILYAVTIETSGNCYIPPYNGITVSGAYVQLVTTVGNAESVTLEVNQAAVATIGDIQSLQKQISDLQAILGYTYISDIIIPASGWTQQENNVQLSDDYGYYIDIQVAAATSEQFPSVSLHKSSLEIASKAGLCPTVQALDGKIRFWARNIPTEDMNATVALLIKSGSNNSASGGNTYKLPVATAEKLGGVKIGDGINVTEDGTISSSGKVDPSNISTKEEVTEMLDEIFKETD